MIRLPRLSLLLVVVLLAGCGTTTNLITGEQTRGAYTWQQEVQLGREADSQVVAKYGLLGDKAVTSYVTRVGQTVLEHSAYTDPETPAEVRNTPFTFRVLDSPVPNAFALPGGFVYVTRGLLAHLDNEAQLAVVLGHEIGHVLGRHASRQASRAQLGQLGLLGAAVLGGVLGGGDVARGVLDVGGTGVQLLFLRYSRDAERESDRAGVAYAEYAGYDASEAAAFFRSLGRLQEQSGAGLPGFLSTHPDPGEREQTIPQLAAQYDTGTIVRAPEYLREIDNMVLGENPRQGFTEGGVFYHPDLAFRFSYPRGWKVANAASSVTISEPNGHAAFQLTLSNAASPRAAVQEVTGQQGVRVSRQGSESIGGYRAYTATGTGQTQQGTIGFRVTAIEYGGNVYRFVGMSGRRNFSQYDAAFRQSYGSFSRLTERRFLNREPVRLDVISTRGSSTIGALQSNRPMPPSFTLENMAILNQVALRETIPGGRRVKVSR